jgi:4'-phosphopantetheinyl transferase
MNKALAAGKRKIERKGQESGSKGLVAQKRVALKNRSLLRIVAMFVSRATIEFERFRFNAMSDSTSIWLSPPAPWKIDRDAVQIWRADLKLSDRVLRALRTTLSEDERARADRFYFERDRAAFVAGRGQLRSLLGRYLNLDPARVKFVYSESGKPALDPALNGDRLEFNVSHSHDVILYAVTRDRAVGVDLEFARPLADAQQLANRFFTPQEAAQLRALPPEQQQWAFFCGWTRKEAFLKATGAGISQLQAVEVSLKPKEPAALLRVQGSEKCSDWLLSDLAVGPGYAGAIAIKTPANSAIQLQQFNWSAASLLP